MDRPPAKKQKGKPVFSLQLHVSRVHDPLFRYMADLCFWVRTSSDKKIEKQSVYVLLCCRRHVRRPRMRPRNTMGRGGGRGITLLQKQDANEDSYRDEKHVASLRQVENEMIPGFREPQALLEDGRVGAESVGMAAVDEDHFVYAAAEVFSM